MGKIVFIGITGEKRSGKDLFCSFLREAAELMGIKTVRRAMADPLKEECARMVSVYFREDYNEVLEQMHGDGPKKERWRMLMQWWGTEGWREKDPDHWIKAMQAYSASYKEAENLIIVVPDIRFMNEIEFIAKGGGMTIQICRPNLLSDNMNHASEQEWRSYKDWNAIIMNDSDTKNLRQEAGILMAEIADCYKLL